MIRKVKDKHYRIIVTVRGEALSCNEFEVSGILGLSMAEKIAESYVKDGYRNREPDGWVYYPAQVIQRIQIQRST